MYRYKLNAISKITLFYWWLWKIMFSSSLQRTCVISWKIHWSDVKVWHQTWTVEEIRCRLADCGFCNWTNLNTKVLFILKDISLTMFENWISHDTDSLYLIYKVIINMLKLEKNRESISSNNNSDSFGNLLPKINERASCRSYTSKKVLIMQGKHWTFNFK